MSQVGWTNKTCVTTYAALNEHISNKQIDELMLKVVYNCSPLVRKSLYNINALVECGGKGLG